MATVRGRAVRTHRRSGARPRRTGRGPIVRRLLVPRCRRRSGRDVPSALTAVGVSRDERAAGARRLLPGRPRGTSELAGRAGPGDAVRGLWCHGDGIPRSSAAERVPRTHPRQPRCAAGDRRPGTRSARGAAGGRAGRAGSRRAEIRSRVTCRLERVRSSVAIARVRDAPRRAHGGRCVRGCRGGRPLRSAGASEEACGRKSFRRARSCARTAQGAGRRARSRAAGPRRGQRRVRDGRRRLVRREARG